MVECFLKCLPDQMHYLKFVKWNLYIFHHNCCSAYGPHCKCMTFSSAMAHNTHTHICPPPFLSDQINYLCRYSVSNKCHTWSKKLTDATSNQVWHMLHYKVCHALHTVMSLMLPHDPTQMEAAHYTYCCACVCGSVYMCRHLTCCAPDEAYS